VNDAAAGSGKPVVAVTLGGDDGPVGPDSPVPAFAFPEPAADALGRVARYSTWRARPAGVVPALDGIDPAAAEAIAQYALERRPGGTLLPLSVTAALLASHGIPMAPARAVTSLDAAIAGAAEVGYPVTLKAAGLEHLGRSESGGVALDLQDADQVRGSYVRMAASLGPAMAEVVVQHMVPAGVETIVTVQDHPSFGPVVAFGLGGAFADAIGDRAVRSVPLCGIDATEMVAASQASHALAAAGASVAAVEELLVRLGILVDTAPAISRVRLNPVLVSAAGAWVIGAHVHVAPPPPVPFDVPLRRLE
jgi:acyl-CoA synthetase (NDP forming)